MGKLFERPFSNHEMDRIERKLNADLERDEPTDYEVRIDGLLVIERTDDPTLFGSVTDHISLGSTQEVEITLYKGKSQHNDKHTLFIERNKPQGEKAQSLEGFSSQLRSEFEKQRQYDRLEWDHKALQEKYQKLSSEHDELKEYSDQLEKDLEVFKGKKLHMGNINLGELGGIFLEGFIRRNPQILARLPGGQALAGIIEEDNDIQAAQMQQQFAQPVQPQAEVSFSAADEPNGPAISPEDQPYLDLLKRIQSAFSQQDFIQVMMILDNFMEQPELIPIVQDLIDGEDHADDQTQKVETDNPNTEDFTDEL
ncbi:MAG: hypothetical protein AAF998_18455 [Bacteroidota bacterium]